MIMIDTVQGSLMMSQSVISNSGVVEDYIVAIFNIYGGVVVITEIQIKNIVASLSLNQGILISNIGEDLEISNMLFQSVLLTEL